MKGESKSGINIVAWKAGTLVHLFILLFKLSVTEHMIVACLMYVRVTSKNKRVMISDLMELLESTEGIQIKQKLILIFFFFGIMWDPSSLTRD